MENYKRYIIDNKKNKREVRKYGFTELGKDFRTGICKFEIAFHYTMFSVGNNGNTSTVSYGALNPDESVAGKYENLIYEVLDFDSYPAPNQITNNTKLVDVEIDNWVTTMMYTALRRLEENDFALSSLEKAKMWYNNDYIVYYNYYSENGDVILKSHSLSNSDDERDFSDERRYFARSYCPKGEGESSYDDLEPFFED